MSYELEISEYLDKVFAKLSKRDKLQFEISKSPCVNLGLKAEVCSGLLDAQDTTLP